MAYSHGSIVLVDNPYGDRSRPVLVVSNESRPYQGKQYTIAIITTTERDTAVRLEDGNITDDYLTIYPSFVNTWSLHEYEHEEINRKVAQLSDTLLEDVVRGINRFVEVNP